MENLGQISSKYVSYKLPKEVHQSRIYTWIWNTAWQILLEEGECWSTETKPKAGAYLTEEQDRGCQSIF